MNRPKTVACVLACVIAALGAAACRDNFLTGGELSTNPNQPQTATDAQLFTGVEANLYYANTGELARVASILAQGLSGALQTGLVIDTYQATEQTLGGDLAPFYAGGGLVDVRKLEASVGAKKDLLFLGIAQVQEAMLMGEAADVWGDLPYTHALTGEANPPLDRQLAIYDSVQALLGRAIANITAPNATSVGPGAADLSYGGNAAKWAQLAHTLKARYYMHTAEARGAAAYTSALAEAQQGISSAANDYKAVFSGAANDRNPWSVYCCGPYANWVVAGRTLDTLMRRRADPRRTQYFTINAADSATTLSATRLAATFQAPIATYAETQLIVAEAAARLGQTATAQAALVAARQAAGFPATAQTNPQASANYNGTPPTGNALLAEILSEEYVNDFMLGVESWKLYRRTCFPNLASHSPTGQPMPGRLYYDPNERATNTNMPAPGTDPNGVRNQADPPNATSDAGGGACRAGA